MLHQQSASERPWLPTRDPQAASHVAVHSNGGDAVISCEGEFDLDNADTLAVELDRVVKGGVQHAIVDLERAEFLDSCTLAVIVRAHQRLAVHGGGLTIGVGDGQPRKLLELTGIADHIPTVESADLLEKPERLE